MNALETTQIQSDQMLVPILTGQPAPPKPGVKVLFAEDDNDLRMIMECSLTAMGYVVVPCANAHLAVAAFQMHDRIDLLLTDLEMPGMSGLELARELTSQQASLPVLLVTGSILSIDTVKELITRGWFYMSKPCDMNALKGTLHRLTNRSARISSFGEQVEQFRHQKARLGKDERQFHPGD
jgi:DNA-binding response OmpR family regulator